MSDYETFEDVLESIPYFIEEVCKRKDYILHWGYLPTEEFEHKFNKNKTHQLVLAS